MEQNVILAGPTMPDAYRSLSSTLQVVPHRALIVSWLPIVWEYDGCQSQALAVAETLDNDLDLPVIFARYLHRQDLAEKLRESLWLFLRQL